MSGFKKYLYSDDRGSEKTKTINIKVSTHDFYKKTSNFYNIGISTLVNNILEDWMKEHQKEINEDIKSNL
ncbi:MAG: hypothetical protein ABJG41_14590 [Cyclobacteriaceae bacterium]